MHALVGLFPTSGEKVMAIAMLEIYLLYLLLYLFSPLYVIILLLLTHTLSSLLNVSMVTLVTCLAFDPGFTFTLSSQCVTQCVFGAPLTAVTL